MNSNIRKLCNAKFVTVSDEIYVIATKRINVGDEVFIHYKIR